MPFYRLFMALMLALLAIAVVRLCYASTIIDQHHSDGHKVRVEINDGTNPRSVSQWQVSLLLPEGFSDRNSILCFKVPVVPADPNNIALFVTNTVTHDPNHFCYQLVILTTEQTPVSWQTSKNGTLVRLKSIAADRPELTSVTTGQHLNDQSHTAPVTLLAYPDNLTDSELETRQSRNNTLTLTGGQFAGKADFSGVGNGGLFYLPPPPPWRGGGNWPSGLFEIDLVILQPVIAWLMSISKDSVSFEEQPSPARLHITRVNADGSASEAVMPVGWLDFLTTEQLTDVHFWNTLFQRAATSCPASESLQWQLSCLQQFLERTALNAHHTGALKAGNVDGKPSGRAPDNEPKDENNDHQKEQGDAPEGRESRSPGESHGDNGAGNNGKDDNGNNGNNGSNGEPSENNATTQNLQELANLLIAIIESDDPDAVFMLRKILDGLDTPQRLQVLETKGKNTKGYPVTPLEAILELPRSSQENSSRNRFIVQLIETTSDEARTLNDPDILSALQPIPPDWTQPEPDDNLRILYKIIQDIIHKANQPDQQLPIESVEKRCFAEYFVQLFQLYSNPVERIRNLSGEISDLATRNEIISDAPSLTFSTSFLNTITQFDQHPSFHELRRFSNELRMQAQYSASDSPSHSSSPPTDITITTFSNNALSFDKEELTHIIGNQCTICHEQFVRSSNIVKTPCNHLYHVDCLYQWLKKRQRDGSTRNCPVCRAKLTGLRKKLQGFQKLLEKYGSCHSLAVADRAVKEWNKAETSYYALYHFVQVCRHNSPTSDDSQFVNILRTLIHPVKKTKIRHQSEINSVVFSANNRRMVTASDDGTVKIYGHGADGSWKEEFTIHHDGPVKSATFSHTNDRVVTASQDHKTKIYVLRDDGSWEEEVTIRHHGPINSASFSADSSRVLTASDDGTAKIHAQKEDGSWEEEVTINHDGPIHLASFSADGSHVVTVGKDNLVKITGKSTDGSWQVKFIVLHEDSVNSAIFSPNNRYLLTASDDGTAKIIGQKDDKSWEEEFTISHISTDGPIESAAFSPDNRHVLTVGKDKLVKIIGKRADGSWVEKAIISHSNDINSAIFSPDSHYVVTASRDCTAKIYGEKTDVSWAEEITIHHDARVFSATFSPDSQHVVTTSQDRTAKIHSHKNDGSWEVGITIRPHYGLFTSAIFSADHRFMMTFGLSDTAKIHRLNDDGSWQEETIIRHSSPIFSAIFSANSRFVVTTGQISSIDNDGIAKITELWKEE